MKTLTKKTHLSAVRQADQNQITQVCKILNWTNQEYCDYQFEQYIQFLTGMFTDWPDVMLQQVLYSPTMRGFFTNEWSKRNDTDFLPFATELTEPTLEVNDAGELVSEPGLMYGDEYLIDEYLLIHNAQALINDGIFLERYNSTLTLIRKEELCYR